MAKLTEVEHTDELSTTTNSVHSRMFAWFQKILEYMFWLVNVPWLTLMMFLGKCSRVVTSLYKTKDEHQDVCALQRVHNILDDNQHQQKHLDEVFVLFPNQEYDHTDIFARMSVSRIKNALRTILIQSPRPAGYIPNANHERILRTLVWLVDNGESERFDEISSCTLQRYGNHDAEITTTVLIEQARSRLYRNQVTKAKSLVRKAIALSTSTEHPTMYVARACIVMSACYRGIHKLGKANKFLETAEQNLVNTAYYEDWCRYYDAYSSYINMFIDTVSNPSTVLLENAKKAFHRQLATANSESRMTVRKKYQFYALLKRARTLLDANALFGQQRKVSTADITMARKCLEKINTELWDSVPRGTHLQFLIVKCLLCFREKKYVEGLQVLEKGIEMSKSIGYEKEHELIVRGTDMLRNLIKVEKQMPASAASTSEEVAIEDNSEKESSVTETIDIFESELADSA